MAGSSVGVDTEGPAVASIDGGVTVVVVLTTPPRSAGINLASNPLDQ